MATSSGVMVVGAGLIGASIAWRLAQSGAEVTLVDAGIFGGETSSAGAGMLSPGGEFDGPSRWLDLGVESMRMYPAFVDELRSETGVPIDFQVCGSKYFIDAAQTRPRAEFQRGVGVEVEIQPEGLYYPGDGFVDPTSVLRALRRALEARNVRILEREPVWEIESADFRAVVVAAGAWSSQIRVTHQGRAIALPPVKPVKGHLIGFDLEPGSLGPMLRRGHTYVLQRSSGFTIAGSTEEDGGFDRRVDPAVCAEIHRRASELFPLLEGRQYSTWAGFRPYSANGPHIRQVEGSNVWLAYGHFRNGILLTPVTSQRIAASIVQDRS